MKKTPCRRESAASGTLMTLQEVADYPRVTRATIHRMLKRNQIPTFSDRPALAFQSRGDRQMVRVPGCGGVNPQVRL
jgi:hypothetical protein